MEKGKEKEEKEEEGLGGGGRTQDPINCDGGQKTSRCDLSLPPLRSLLTWTGYDSMMGCLQTVHVRAKTNSDTGEVPPLHCTITALLLHPLEKIRGNLKLCSPFSCHKLLHWTWQ